MTTIDPGQRPPAKDALNLWVEMRKKIPLIKAMWRPRPNGEGVREATVQDAISLFNAFTYYARAVLKRSEGGN